MEKEVSSPGRKRVEYIDIAKAFAIFLVLLGHTVDSGTACKNVLYSFHMPLFFLLSGMVINRKKYYGIKSTWVPFLRKKFFSLLIPYLIWGCIYASFSFKNLVFIAYGSRETLGCAGSLTSLWFIPVLILASLLSELFFYCSEKIRVNRNLLIVITCLCLSIVGFTLPHWGKYGDPWGIDIAFVAAVFILLGYLLRPIGDILERKHFLLQILVLILSAIVFIIGIRYNITSTGYVLMANAIYGNYAMFLLNAVAGSLIVILFSAMVSRLHFNKKFLFYIGQNTLGIFIVHKPLVELGRLLAARMGMNYNNIMLALTITIISMICACIIIKIISNFAPELLGKETRYKEIS